MSVVCLLAHFPPRSLTAHVHSLGADCGNELENFSRPILGCEPDEGAMPCKGNSGEYCGGPDLLYVYTLPGTDLVPLIPFDSEYDGI
jgi:hypothetical protein